MKTVQVERMAPTKPLAAFFFTLAALLVIAASPATSLAVTYTWSSATLGGLWSTAANWNPSTGTPVAGDIAVLDTVTGTTLRTVTYDTLATGTLNTLTLNQTASGTNTLDVQRNLTVSNTITLGASNGGLARLLLSTNSGTTNNSTILTGNIVINAGGMLSQMVYNPVGGSLIGAGNIAGNVLVQGGQFIADSNKQGTSNGTTSQVSGTFTMTSGTLTIVNPANFNDRRFQVNALSVSGGEVLTTATNGNLATITIQNAGANTFNPTNFSSTAVQISLTAGSGTQSLTSNQILNVLARGNGVKPFTSSLSGTNFGSLVLVDGGTTSASTIFQLGSNLTLAAGRNLPRSDAPTPLAAQRFDLGIDLGPYTMDLTANSGTFTPNTSYGSGTATTYWTFTGSGGRIIANGFNLSGTGGVATSVGPGVILESRSGNGGVNNLSLGSGTGTLLIDPSSIFRYSGTASASAPATLTSSRAIGNVEIQSGALNVLSLAGMGTMNVSGGTLIATNSTGLPSSPASLTVANGAAVLVGNDVDDATFNSFSSGAGVAAGASFGFDTSAGDRIYSGTLNSALGFVKTGSNLLTLSGALGSDLSAGRFGVLGGSLDLGGNSLSRSGTITIATTGTVQNGTLTNDSVAFDAQSGSVSAGLSSLAGLTKTTTGTLALAGPNSFAGGVRINGGVLSVGSVGALGTSGSITFGGGTLLYAAGNAVDYSSRILGSGSTVSIDMNGQAVTFASAINSTNTGGFTRTGAGLLTLSGTGAYTGGTMTLNGGTTVIDPGVGNSASFGAFKVMSGVTGTAIATIASGSVAISPSAGNYFVVGDGNAGSAGTVNFTGGSTTIDLSAASSRMMIGNKVSGAMNVSGGNVTVTGANPIYIGGDASFAVSNATGALTISGGTMAVTGSGGFILGNSGTNNNANTGVVGTLNLNGGEFQTIRDITRGTSGTAANAQSGNIYFNGGVLKPLASSTSFMTGLTGAYVQNGNALIDTNGFNITIGQALLSGTGGSTGGLTKSGLGTLSLTGSSTYTGPTTVAGGTLALSGGGNRLPVTSTLAFAGGNAALNGISQTVAGLTVPDSTSAAVVGIGTSDSRLNVTNAIMLGGGSGVSTLLVTPQMSGAIAAAMTLTATSGITVNAGGELRFGALGYTSGTFVNPDKFVAASGSGTPITISGGTMTLAPMVTNNGQTTTGTAGAVLTRLESLTMTSGLISIDNTINPDRRLAVYGPVTITGGAITNAVNDAKLELFNYYTHNLSPASMSPTLNVTQYLPSSGTDATLTAGVPLSGGLTVRGGVGTLTLTSSVSGPNVGSIQLGDSSGTVAGQGTTLRLGSNLTLTAGAATPAPHFSFTPEADNRIDLGLDANGFTFDLTNSPNVWTPSRPSTAQAYWRLSSTSGTGRFIANGYNFSAAAAFTSVGPNVILESTAGNGVANNLGTSGTTGLVTIDPTSIFRYSGTAAIGTPSTLTSARSIGDLEVAGPGALRVTSIAGSVGNVRVSGGSLLVGGTAAFTSIPSLSVTGGTFDVAGYATTITDLAGSAGGTITSSSNATVTLTVGGANATRYDGVLANSAGTLNLTKTGAGTLTLGGANTFTGTTTISEGLLVLDNAAALQNSTFNTAGIASLSFGSLTAASFGGLVGSGDIDLTTLTDGLTIGGGNRSSTYDGVLSGAGGLTKTGTGTFTLTGAQTYVGPTTISQGTLQIGSSGTTGALPGAVTNNGVLAFNRSNSMTFSDAIDGTGSVTQSGGGRLTLSGSNSYSGGTLVTGTGSLAIASPASIGSGTITLQTSQTGFPAVLALTSGMTLPNAINFVQVANNRNNLDTTEVTTLSGPLTISGTGNSTNILSNASGALGLTTVAGNLTAASTFTGNVSLRGNILVTGTINMLGANLDLNASGTTTIASTGNAWTFTQFQATNNVLKLGVDDALPTNARIQFSGNSTGGGLDLNGFSQTIQGFTSDSGTIPAPLARIFNNAANDSTLTIAGLFTNRSANIALADGTGGGRLALVMNSAGRTQTLASATSSYSGGTTIVAGTLAQGAANALGSTNGALAVNGGTLDLGGFGLAVGTLSGSAGGVVTSGTAGAVTFTAGSASDSTFSGLIEDGSGTVAFTKVGSGALTLTAANTYTGLTTVSDGSLVVNGSLAGEVATLANAALGGSGSVGAISGAGLVGPGNSPGILTAPSVDPAGGLDFAFEFTQATPDYGNSANSGNDLLWLTGGTPFTSSLGNTNTVSIYLTQAAAGLDTLTGGFFTANTGDFLTSIQGATFQYFVQDASGSFTYNGQNYTTLSQFDASRNFSVSTVAQNSGQVMQIQHVVVPEPGALVLAGIGVVAAAWGLRRRAAAR